MQIFALINFVSTIEQSSAHFKQHSFKTNHLGKSTMSEPTATPTTIPGGEPVEWYVGYRHVVHAEVGHVILL